MKKNLPLNEWLRVGNKDIKKKSQRSKKKKLEVRGGTCPLSTPLAPPLGITIYET